MKRTLSAILLITMLASMAASCGDTADDTPDTSVDTTPVTTVPAETTEALDLPADLKYDDTVTILTAEGILASEEELTDEMTVLQQAMYERTAAVEERLGVTLEFIPVNPWTETAGLIRQSVNAQSDDYQLTFTCASAMVSLVNANLMLSHDELPYIDIDKPWWNKQYIESVSLHEDDQYILFGDISYNMLQRTTCVFFNANLLESKLNMKPEDLYDLVYEGKWTIDKFTELVSQVYEDDNGNTINDADDIHGLSYLGPYPMNWMAFSSGLDFTGRDENGYPSLNLNNEKTIDLIDKLCKLFVNNEAAFSANSTDNRNEFANKFGEGKALFVVNRFYLAGWNQLRDMENDYGILPMPKYSEDIDGYHSTVEELVQWGGVPVTVTDPNMVSAVAEALAYESYMRTTDAYYETTLKLKLTRDDASMEMLDLIMSGRDTDYLFINSLGGMNQIFTYAFSAGQNNFASEYARFEQTAKIRLQELIDNYQNKTY